MALSPPIEQTPDEVRTLLSPLRNRFSIAVYCAGNTFAVGAIIRVAHSFLAKEILLIGEDTYYSKASMAMEKYECIHTFKDNNSFLSHIATRPLWAIEKDIADCSLPTIATFPDDVVFLFGSERFGLSPEILEHCSQRVGIPMYGINHSFPLAVAAGIVLYAWSTRHYTHGAIV